MDKIREEFEAWFKSAHTKNTQRIDEEYVHGATERLWQAWQASRAAIKVELPPEHEQAYGAYDGAELRYMLKQAGISYE